ncbi:DNA translocase FtsK [Roseospira marina]|uniref:DNA translocase FtsK n=1 Tax=Roseospira marina TaxID=140057 RepID=A0A5M6ID83_9PROT|nr:DNA translocase FtsK [Roseospira marina]KAA5606193.1 DNA translocase FtsK [Roseospira marina]MBB4314338.1 S-DNA-T family DNA segregation ATPase FtsK/SpoIIIE [Roseospira marina]MBB5087498.1 S-DNA-T family DNA segregation ATPase FtsK/SpoIIIE [Roseospira marina]
MSRSAAGVQRMPFLPPAAAVGLARLTRRAAGLAVLALTSVILAALLTYEAADPSWNVASAATPRNMMGVPGALLADAVVQWLGLVTVLPVLGLGVLSLRLMSGEPLRPRSRPPLALLAALPLLALALATLAPGSAWPSYAGAGGVTGTVLHTWTLHLLAMVAPRGAWDLVPGAVAAGLAGWLCVIALGLRWRHVATVRTGVSGAATRIQTIGRSGAGWLAHLRAAVPTGERREPVLGGAAPEDPHNDSDAVPAPEAKAPTPRATRRAVVEAPAKPPAARAARETLRARQGTLFVGGEESGEDGPAVLPPLDLLNPPRTTDQQRRINEEALANNARLLEGVLGDFGIKGEIVRVRPGPVVTLYELEPARGIKTARIIGLADDIARAMSAVSVRIAVIPGKSVIGIELPNARRQGVNLREMLASEEFAGGDLTLTLALGRDIGGGPVHVDLSRMPHLLIAGTTGSGKSVAVNAMILSLLYRLPPDRCRLILIDPKMLELSAYDDIPHLLTPVVTDPGKAVVALKWAVKEMENRYRAMSQLGVRNIRGFNQKVEKALADGGPVSRTVQTGFDPDTGEPVYEQQEMDLSPLPHIVIVVDEMADLMLVAGKEVEAAIQRLAQMARAAGIHLIMATQRPSVDVITGTIKANFPTRVSFQVTSKIDSRTVLGEQGAEQLLGQGDMLYMAAGGRITRVHGPFVSDEEVERVCDHLRGLAAPTYVESVTVDEDEDAEDTAGSSVAASEPLFDRAVDLVARERKASTSFVQRHLQIGYNRAARIIERMEKEGMVSRANAVGKREVLLPPQQAA